MKHRLCDEVQYTFQHFVDLLLRAENTNVNPGMQRRFVTLSHKNFDVKAISFFSAYTDNLSLTICANVIGIP